ncbi:hypothetical protein T265_00706 [Opisthorchis viverrini]|uniref:Uncharacterized protein n=1 Tax=Opisthorchis viverrini TaxID=6198 RepID=A0A075A1Z4_OPIVI|nr:hypothetical protein T265_00706 [Opisthorchis viverrini]KER33386.1 hypothetical protein T265_00706 [Opisthorchis viverrini]
MSMHNPDSHLGNKGTAGDLSGSPHADPPAIHFQPQFGYVAYTCQPLNSPESFELLPPNIQMDSPFLHSNCLEERADDYSRESCGMRETLSYGNPKDLQEARSTFNLKQINVAN